MLVMAVRLKPFDEYEAYASLTRYLIQTPTKHQKNQGYKLCSLSNQ